MKFKKILGIIMTGIMLSANIPINAFADEALAVDAVLSEDSVTSESAVTVSDNNIRLDFSVISQWNGGFNGEITINNLSDKVIENWQIEMEFPHEITNIWNAVVVSNENTVYNIKNAGGNNAVNIPIGGSVTFGFTGTYEDEIISPQNIRLVTGKADADNESYCVDYTLLSDWGSGYSAQITITNNSDTPMEAWDLEFEFDREIETIWNAVIKEHVGNKYYITNAAYNSIIPAKSSICFGFNGSKGESSDEPENYKLIHSGNVIYTDIDGKEETDNEKDTDGDKLPDWFEEITGSSIDKIDSDGDGLTDYDEAALTGTDPTKYDTDGNGVCDADEDTDSDNIANIKEIELGTYPLEADSDGDGLNDYDELYIYFTDPLKCDTDYDGVLDNDEILLGLNPNEQDTDNDGVKDGEEKIKQTIEEEICCDELPGITKIAVTIDVSENIKYSVGIENMYNKNVLSSDLVGIEGAPMDITCSQDFDTAEIIFTYDEDKLDTAPENLGILWYDEDEQFYKVMDTTLDKDNHCISMTTPHFSEYTVVDLTKWFKAWEQKIDYQAASIAKKNASWNGKVVTAQQLCDEYNNFFGYEDVVQLNNVLGACEQGDIYAKTAIVQVKLKNGVVLYYPCIFMALSEFNGITLSITDYNAAPSPDCGGWSVAYVDYDQAEYQFEHFEDYGNIWPKYEDISYIGRQFYNNYFVPAGQVDTTDNDNDGLYDIYELTGMRIANGQVIYTKTNTDAAEEENETLGYDTDGEGLSDGEEIIRQDTERGYFILKSDPNNTDSDFDGVLDDEDPKPLDSKIVAEDESSQSMIKLIDYLNWDVKYKDKFISDMLKLTNAGFKMTYEGNDAYISLRKDVNGNIIKINDDLPEYSKSICLVEQLMDSDITIDIKLCLLKNSGFNEDNDTGDIEISYAPMGISYTFIHTGEYYNNRPVGELRIRPISHTHIALAHEFIHALHDINGIRMATDIPRDPYPLSDFYVCFDGEYTKFFDNASYEEMFTIGTMLNPCVTNEILAIAENEIRQEHGISKRLTHNNVDVKTKGSGGYITYLNWIEEKILEDNQ